MPLQSVRIGPLAAVYIGVYGASDVLTELKVQTTGEEILVVDLPEEFLFATGNTIQSGPKSASCAIEFLKDDPDIVKLAAGNWITTQYQDAPSTFSQYVLLLVHPDYEEETCVLLPRCNTRKITRINWAKTKATTTALQFSHLDPDDNTQVHYKRTLSDLVTILGARSPI